MPAPLRPAIRGAWLLPVLLPTLWPPPAQAQWANCPPGTKEAAGACVRTCPGGYEDRGTVCVYRSESH
ncbi:hypothetical protein [Methylobacterium tarhaniae]|uniref:hypothetical protein n=1 Tax=Methylobacterium tarhaniae TaxID=1187852 RepID=UPI001FD8C38E|nr:hypothetical protein [Methylobacterium tarhaniae]